VLLSFREGICLFQGEAWIGDLLVLRVKFLPKVTTDDPTPAFEAYSRSFFVYDGDLEVLVIVRFGGELDKSLMFSQAGFSFMILG